MPGSDELVEDAISVFLKIYYDYGKFSQDVVH